MERIRRNRLPAGSRRARGCWNDDSCADIRTPTPTSGASTAASKAVGRPNRANRRSVRARRAPGRELMGRTGAPSARTGWVRRHRGPHGEPRARSWSRPRLPVQVLIGVSTGRRCGEHQRPVPSTAHPYDQPIPGGTAQPRRPPQCPRDRRASAGRQRVCGSSSCRGAGEPHICRPPPGCRAPLAAQRAGARRVRGPLDPRAAARPRQLSPAAQRCRPVRGAPVR